ncbi:MAG: 30S ribosomal protein S15 [Chitinispirillia bacterium]|nr:30S ribosomal protein S15 [Chitinispirillia bacterium]MCL2240931.1 30S ribosomal protein S15 [Chitinispirillia bacterium]MCL2242109.1 30S ribosomal protein S15 [Chitinispirillia bacterium]
MALTKERKHELTKTFGKSEKDTGNTDVQVALLTDRINYLTEHVKANPKDHHTRYGLLKLVGQRRSLLNYLSRTDIGRYRELIKKLNIRK